jgi:hypothetical protein
MSAQALDMVTVRRRAAAPAAVSIRVIMSWDP